ncbi:MAG: glycoside hydrolase [Alistipes sp.]|nr:glycoside hydrolase [Alistipes sp.]
MKIKTLVASLIIACGAFTATAQEIAFGAQREGWMRKAEECKPQLKETIVKPKAIVRSVADEAAFQGWRMEQAEPIEALYSSSLKERNTVILDLGDHYTGYFTMKLNHTGMPADAPIRLRLTFGEVPAELNTPFDPYPGGLSRAWLQDEVVQVMRLPEEVKVQRRLACRYVKIEVLATSYFDFRIEDVTFRAITSAHGEAPALAEGTDPMIQKINEIGLKTLAECMQTVYEDGPKRDQRLWIGDLYLEALANAVSYKNHELTKRCLYLLAGMADEEGFLHATVYELPTPMPQINQHTMDYSLLYGVALLEYFKETGDRTTAEELWPVVKYQIDYARTYLKDNIYDVEKQPQYWLVFDWKDDLNRHTPIQGLMTFAIDKSYELATLLGREKEVADWPKLLKDMRKASREAFYDKKRGVMVSGPDSQVSYLSQVWMILSGTLSAKEGARALEYVLSDNSTCYPGSPYAYHYVIEAMMQCGMQERARELLLDYWGGMIKKGADTFWEVYDPNDDKKSPYQFFPINSYCHAWSCTPVYFIYKYPETFQR